MYLIRSPIGCRENNKKLDIDDCVCKDSYYESPFSTNLDCIQCEYPCKNLKLQKCPLKY